MFVALQRLPNWVILNTAVSNTGQSTQGRVKVLFRVSLPDPSEARNFVRFMADEMRHWCSERRAIYKRKTFSLWLESRNDTTLFEDLRVCTIGMQVALVSLRPADLGDFRKHKTEFLLQVRVVAAKARVGGVAIDSLDLYLDASSKSTDLPAAEPAAALAAAVDAAAKDK